MLLPLLLLLLPCQSLCRGLPQDGAGGGTVGNFGFGPLPDDRGGLRPTSPVFPHEAEDRRGGREYADKDPRHRQYVFRPLNRPFCC